MFIVFFFSSRRRHTRFDCDWSSDVCSSDLLAQFARAAAGKVGADDGQLARGRVEARLHIAALGVELVRAEADRKSTRLNSSHSQISYAVFCLKKKNRRVAAAAAGLGALTTDRAL